MVPCEVRRVDVTGIDREGVEAAARRARYQALSEALRPGELLMTAHHQNDQGETVLLQLLRGSGISGLSAMAMRSPFVQSELLRPLLDISRDALRRYADSAGLDWITDPSNADPELRRNFLRHEVLPRLEPYWPNVAGLLARTAEHSAEAQGLLNELARMDLAVCHNPGSTGVAGMLSIPALKRLSSARQRNLIRYWLKSLGFLVPTKSRLDELIRLIQVGPRSRHACVRWDGAELWIYQEGLAVLPSWIEPSFGLQTTWNPAQPINVAGIGGLQSRLLVGQGISLERLCGSNLLVQVRRGGERLRLPGRRHHHALKKLLQAEQVPPWERTRLPIFYANGDLVAVADRWISADYAAEADEPALGIVWERFSGPMRPEILP